MLGEGRQGGAGALSLVPEYSRGAPTSRSHLQVVNSHPHQGWERGTLNPADWLTTPAPSGEEKLIIYFLGGEKKNHAILEHS